MTSETKDVYIDKLNDIAKKYNNTYHSTRKMKPVDVKLDLTLTLEKKLMTKIHKKLVMILEYKNIKI